MRSHLQSALYRKAKAESGYRFWSLYGELTWAVNDPGVKGQPVLIRYADDFVILCGAGQGAALRERLERWLQGRGLELNKEKTRVADSREGFDFLGFRVRWQKSRKAATGMLTPRQAPKASKSSDRQ